MDDQTSVVLAKLITDKKNELAPTMSDDSFFEVFSSEQILKKLDLSYEEISDGNVGNGGDGGIDSIYIVVNEILLNTEDELPKFKGDVDICVYIIQSKNENSFGEDVVKNFISSAEDILCFEKSIDSLKSVYNLKLLKHINILRKVYLDNIAKIPSISFFYYYASKGSELHPNVERKVDSLESIVKRFFSSAQFQFEFITGKKLLECALSKKRKSFNLKFKENPVSTADGGYIGIVNLIDYYTFIVDDQKSLIKFLFDANVRDYQGGTTVNKEIANTLNTKDETDFWWFNNGITIISEKASLANKILTLTDPQIVNGCQTSYEIYNHILKNKVTEDHRSLAVKVVQTSNDAIRANIIKYTNSQTLIPISVLSATDPIHRNIEQFFLPHGLYYDRRKNFWKNEQKPIKDIVSISTLAQAFTAMILQEPHIARSKPSSLMKNEDDYKRIFSIDYPLEAYYRVIEVQRHIENSLNSYSDFEPGDGLNIRHQVQLFFILCQRKNKVKEVKNIKKYLNEFLELKLNFDIENTNAIIKKVHDIYIQKGRSDTVAKAKYFTESLIEECHKS